MTAPRCDSFYHTNGTKIVYAIAFAPKDTAVSELTDYEGNLHLFRVIDRKYVKDFIGGFGEEEGSISYSLNPFIAQIWKNRAPFATDGHVLVARHKVATETLLYPTHDDYVGFKLKTRLMPQTRLSDIHYLNQVNVPFGKEQLVAIFRISDFETLAETFAQENPSGFLIEDFVSYLLRSPKKVFSN